MLGPRLLLFRLLPLLPGLFVLDAFSCDSSSIIGGRDLRGEMLTLGTTGEEEAGAAACWAGAGAGAGAGATTTTGADAANETGGAAEFLRGSLAGDAFGGECVLTSCEWEERL